MVFDIDIESFKSALVYLFNFQDPERYIYWVIFFTIVGLFYLNIKYVLKNRSEAWEKQDITSKFFLSFITGLSGFLVGLAIFILFLFSQSWFDDFDIIKFTQKYFSPILGLVIMFFPLLLLFSKHKEFKDVYWFFLLGLSLLGIFILPHIFIITLQESLNSKSGTLFLIYSLVGISISTFIAIIGLYHINRYFDLKFKII